LPTNALLVPSSGIFTWRPTIAQSPSTNLISLIVTDNGTPSLSATQSFGVVVLRPVAPAISALHISNGIFTMMVAGDAGPDFGLYASTNLISWELIQQTNPPLLPFRFIDSAAVNCDQRFYRIQLLP
jgi:hypothetical protein